MYLSLSVEFHSQNSSTCRSRAAFSPLARRRLSWPQRCGGDEAACAQR
jgi:hypothetical protein